MQNALKLSFKIWGLFRIIEIVAAMIFASIVWTINWTPESLTGLDAIIFAVRSASGALFAWYIIFLYAIISWFPIAIFSFKHNRSIGSFIATVCFVYIFHSSLVLFLVLPNSFYAFPENRFWLDWGFLLAVNFITSWVLGKRVLIYSASVSRDST